MSVPEILEQLQLMESDADAFERQSVIARNELKRLGADGGGGIVVVKKSRLRERARAMLKRQRTRLLRTQQLLDELVARRGAERKGD